MSTPGTNDKFPANVLLQAIRAQNCMPFHEGLVFAQHRLVLNRRPIIRWRDHAGIAPAYQNAL